MKTYNKCFIYLAAAVALASCGNEDELTEPTVLPLDYTLPQGGTDAATDARIVGLYEKYGTYFLYDYSHDDLTYTIVGSGGGGMLNQLDIEKPETNYVGKQLDLLEKVFFHFYPEDFLKKNLPYKVFLAKSVKWELPWAPGTFTEWPTTYGDNSLICAWCDARLESLTTTDLYNYFNFINRDYLSWMLGQGKLSFPEAFYEVSDYSEDVYASMYEYYSYPDECFEEWVMKPEQQMLEKGFLQDNYSYNISSARSTDISNYLTFMRYFAPDSPQWQYFLQFPLVKMKYDLLRQYMKENYGWDPATMGTAKF